MASRLIIRRRKHLLDHLNASVHLTVYPQVLSHGRPLQERSTRYFGPILEHSPLNLDKANEQNESVTTKEELVSFTAARLLKQPLVCVSIKDFGYNKVDSIFPFGVKHLLRTVRTTTSTTADQLALRGGNELDEEKDQKPIKEASPEECDEAVEGLSTAKAKAKAKQVQESHKIANSLLVQFWAMILGIVPALRAIASMSRADWANKLIHWKHELVATLQHYWLGFKLLWADMRISSRLLLKLAGGKNLSRRERQQLTRTTADIFRKS